MARSERRFPMSEMDDVMEAEVRGTEIQSAVLHVLDGRHHNILLSEKTLDLDNPGIEKYVKRYVNRCRGDMRARPGTFRDNSVFARELEKYFRQETSLPLFSAAVCGDLTSYFENEEARSFEVLFIDYRTDDVPYIAAVLLEEQETMTYITEAENGLLCNTISFGHTALPAVSRQVASFAVVNVLNREISFVDEGKWKDGNKVITDTLLGAEAGVSRKEVVESVKEIACEVAEEFHENPTIVLSRVKNYIADTVSEGMPLRPEILAAEMFEEKPEMGQVFMRKAEEKTLPKEVELPKASVRMSMKKQKITTDTGIEIAFPAEYARDNSYIEFVEKGDGSITIEIKQVNKVTNRM